MTTNIERRRFDIQSDILANENRIRRLTAERDESLRAEIHALLEARKNLQKELFELNQGEKCKRQ